MKQQPKQKTEIKSQNEIKNENIIGFIAQQDGVSGKILNSPL